MNIVIMAGGGGTRLWPLSRQGKPKQFLDLGSGKTLLEHTFDRAKTIVDERNIFIATTKDLEEQVVELLPEVPAANILFEADRRDTAPAFAAVAIHLQRMGLDQEPALFMWSDHIFTNEKEYLGDLQKMPKLLSEYPNVVVIAGHTPVSAETGLGYLEVGEPVKGYKDVYKVNAFKEKPDKSTAEKYLAAGNYYWNMGSICLRPAFLLEELRKYEPELMAGIDKYAKALEAGSEDGSKAVYRALPKLAIDYALLEKTANILAVTGFYGWSDVGNWGAVKEIFGIQGDHVKAGHHVHVDSSDNYIYNATDKAVSLIGIKDTIAVITEDAVLITHKDSTHKVKEVVQELEKDHKQQYL